MINLLCNKAGNKETKHSSSFLTITTTTKVRVWRPFRKHHSVDLSGNKNVAKAQLFMSMGKSYSAEQVPTPSKRGNIPRCFVLLDNRLWNVEEGQWWGLRLRAYIPLWSLSAAERWGLMFSCDEEAVHWGGAGEHLSRRARETKTPRIWSEPWNIN